MPTGGFSTKNASIAHYGSAYFDGIVVLFMLISGINFSLHYRLLRGQGKVFLDDSEFRVFLGLIAIFIFFITLDTYGSIYSSLSTALRYAAFQVSSIITTTGFVTANYDQWPALSKIILLICMFLGAMAGSTGGGMKIMRTMLLVKHSYREIFRLIHPHAVTTVKLAGKPVSPEIVSSIGGFFVLYLGIFLSATLVMASLGLDMMSALASVAASIGNIGPGFGTVGPVKNFSEIPVLGKWILSFCMLLGRLEIFTVLILLVPEFWRK
jgi:trk system potassium uptake protein TrkH